MMSDPVSAITGGVSLIGGLSGSDAASSAADAQSQAAAEATAETRREYDLNRADLTPGRNLYTGASNALANYLGLSIPNSGGSNGANGSAPLSFAQWQAQQPMRQQTIQQPMSPNSPVTGLNEGGIGYYLRNQGNNQTINVSRNVSTGTQSGYQNYLNSLNTGQSTQNPANFGEGLRHFDQNALNNDLVYTNGLDFGLNEGRDALLAQQRARGSSGGGKALKDLTRFGNDYATTKTNDSFNRFNTTKQQDYNFLSGAAGLGQNSANATVQAGQNASNNVSNNILSAGNARSAGIVGSNNSWQNALSNITKQFGSFGSGGGNASPGIIWN